MAADEIERFRREIVESTGDARAGDNITDQVLSTRCDAIERKFRYTMPPMERSPSSFQSLARRLLAVEAATNTTVNPQAHEGVRVCTKLGSSLTRFAGAEGFTSLLRRALALARRDNTALEGVTLNPDGSLEGLERLASDVRNGGREAAVEIVAHLLGLLVTFIGEPHTLRLVREGWPDASLDD